MPTALTLPTVLRRTFVVVGLCIVLALTGWQFDLLFRNQVEVPFDFAAFWVAGYLAANGENPYQPNRIHAIQRTLGIDDKAVVVWNPPWTMSMLMPFGALPFRLAFGAWELFHITLMLAAAGLLWRGLGGSPRQAWMVYLLTLVFIPTAFLIGGGQITAVVLLGLAGFMAAARRERPFAAGLMAGLTAVKPHLVTLFALWLLLEATRSRFGRRVLLGGMVIGCLACLLATAVRPAIWSDYWNALTSPTSSDHHQLSEWSPPLLGWWLRSLVPGKPFWVQWLPLCLGALAFLGWWLKIARQKPVDWAGWLPGIVGASMLIAPYGAWQYDLVLLLVPILAVARKLADNPTSEAVKIGGFLLILVDAALLIMLVNRTPPECYVWATPVIMIAGILVMRLAAKKTEPFPTMASQSPVGA